MPASTAAVRATHKVGLEEGVVVVVVDGVEMRGGNGGLEGRKERNAFSSELRVDYISALICPLWFFSQICSVAAPGVASCVCVNICLNHAKHQKHFHMIV